MYVLRGTLMSAMCMDCATACGLQQRCTKPVVRTALLPTRQHNKPSSPRFNATLHDAHDTTTCVCDRSQHRARAHGIEHARATGAIVRATGIVHEATRADQQGQPRVVELADVALKHAAALPSDPARGHSSHMRPTPNSSIPAHRAPSHHKNKELQTPRQNIHNDKKHWPPSNVRESKPHMTS